MIDRYEELPKRCCLSKVQCSDVIWFGAVLMGTVANRGCYGKVKIDDLLVGRRSLYGDGLKAEESAKDDCFANDAD